MWIIFYEDREYTSLDGKWEDAPNTGVVGVLVLRGKNSHGIDMREIHTGSDWYGYIPEEDRFVNGDTHEQRGKWIRCDLNVPMKFRKKGLWIDNGKYGEIKAKMMGWTL